jgi:hypothetical protein
MRASSEHGRSGILTLGSYNVGMSVSTDDTASEAIVRKDHGSSVVDVVTEEDDTVVVEGSHVSGVPGKDGRRVTNVDVVRVTLDGEAHGDRRRPMSEIREMNTNLVCVLSRSSGEGVLEGSPIESVLKPMSGLREELGDQQRGSGGHGRR